MYLQADNTHTKQSLVGKYEFAQKMCWHQVIVSGSLPVWSNDEMYSRLTSLSCWLAHHCSKQGFSFVDNWSSLQGHPDLLKGLHPSGIGAAILSRNIHRGKVRFDR